MSWYSLKNHTVNTDSGKSLPFTFLIGAGIHHLHQPKDALIYEAIRNLSSWDRLISKVGCSNYSYLSQTMRWEICALESQDDISDADASNMVQAQQEKLRSVVKQYQNVISKSISNNVKIKQLKSILKSPYVTDVISLNIDLVLELLLAEKIPCVKSGKISTLERRREIKRECVQSELHNDKLRVWHPHGDISNADSLAFGLWRYEKLIHPLKDARANIKKIEREKGFDCMRQIAIESPENWFQLMMFRPLVIIGTSLDDAEWDIWYALLSRWRNFAKSENKKYESPIWYLTTEKEYKKNALNQRFPNDRVEFLLADDWDTAWKWLADILSNAGNSV